MVHDGFVSETPSARIAVLIDADNTSPRSVGDLLEEIAKYGIPTVKRAYGDWTTQNLAGWKAELLKHAIQPKQQFAYTTGKNSTDSALIIDAMDLLYTATSMPSRSCPATATSPGWRPGCARAARPSTGWASARPRSRSARPATGSSSSRCLRRRAPEGERTSTCPTCRG